MFAYSLSRAPDRRCNLTAFLIDIGDSPAIGVTWSNGGNIGWTRTRRLSETSPTSLNPTHGAAPGPKSPVAILIAITGLQMRLAPKRPARPVLVDEIVESGVAGLPVKTLDDELVDDVPLQPEQFLLAAMPYVLGDSPMQQGPRDVVA